MLVHVGLRTNWVNVSEVVIVIVGGLVVSPRKIGDFTWLLFATRRNGGRGCHF